MENTQNFKTNDDLVRIDPINIKVLSVDKFITDHNCQEVTSTFITDPASNTFDTNGLFSERIFGLSTSPERMVKLGYINLRTKVFHPRIYRAIIKLAGFYENIMNGSAHAKFNKETKQLEACESIDPEGGTGYAFFMKWFPKIKFERNDSLSRNNRIDILEKYKNDLLVDKWLVMPAGLRDVEVDEMTNAQTKGDINSLYIPLINYTRAIPQEELSPDLESMLDTLRMSIQKKLLQINDFIQNILEGKTGFLEGSIGHRSVALGTADVISPAVMQGETVDDPNFPKFDESQYPLVLVLKAFQPIIIHAVNHYWFSSIVNDASAQVALIDKNYKLNYIPLSSELQNNYFSTDGIVRLTNRFKDVDYRNLPAAVEFPDRSIYYLYLVYDLGEEVYYFRDINAFKTNYTTNTGKEYDIEKVRPLTWVELFYFAVTNSIQRKYFLNTRYPVLHPGSIYPSRIHILTTIPSRKVKIYFNDSTEPMIELPEYPMQNGTYTDSVRLHPSHLSNDLGLNADFDGDRLNFNSIISDNAVKEIKEYQDNLEGIIRPDGRLTVGLDTYLIQLTMFAMSQRLNK